LQHGLELDPSRPRQVATEQIDGPLARIHPGPGRPYKILPTAARAAPLARVHPSVAVAAVDHVNAMPIIAWSSGPPQLGLVADGASCAARQIPPRASFPGPAPTTSSGVAVGTSTAYKQLISLSDADIRLYSSVADHGRRDSSVSSVRIVWVGRTSLPTHKSYGISKINVLQSTSPAYVLWLWIDHLDRFNSPAPKRTSLSHATTARRVTKAKMYRKISLQKMFDVPGGQRLYGSWPGQRMYVSLCMYTWAHLPADTGIFIRI
jgi:hypothetical protein